MTRSCVFTGRWAMTNRNNESARAVVLAPSGHVLLIRIAGYRGELWITPGGRIRPGEEPKAAVMRELEEETGISGLRPGAEIWVRHAAFLSKGETLEEEERFFMVPAERFEPTTTGMEPAELEVFREFRWWSVEEIVASRERFAPQRLGELLLALRRDGPPASPVETGA